MRWPLIILVCFIISCKSLSETEKLHQTLTGKWLIVSPDHNLKDGWQKIIYSHVQDSIVELKGLILVQLHDNGTFQQIDSNGKKGQWGITADNVAFIEKGGKGFENFSANFTGYKDGLLQLTEFAEVENEKIQLTWNFKKVTGSYTNLFEEKNNEWRKRPNQPESDKQIKDRLALMLNYYADYYMLVTKESNFFIPARVILPLKFYQHAIGTKPFDEQSYFAKLFFNKQQAEQAWQYLKRTITLLRNDFPRKKDYLEEYAEFMEQMADEIGKPD